MRRSLALLIVVALALGACASHPEGAYFPLPEKPDTVVISHTLYRAAEARLPALRARGASASGGAASRGARGGRR